MTAAEKIAERHTIKTRDKALTDFRAKKLAADIQRAIDSALAAPMELLKELAKEHAKWQSGAAGTGHDLETCSMTECVRWREHRDRLKALGCWEGDE